MLRKSGFVLLAVFCGFCSATKLWSQGVVHYHIDENDYDYHSQDVITSTLAKIEKEICVKFFRIPANYSLGNNNKRLVFNNPEKLKHCPHYEFDLDKSVVELHLGYNCLNAKEMTKIIVDMLLASIKQSNAVINSFDLIEKFKKINDNPTTNPSLVPPKDRNYINANYNEECHKLSSKPNLAFAGFRRNNAETEDEIFSDENKKFFNNKQWPLGIVMYEYGLSVLDAPFIQGMKRPLNEMDAINKAMAVIESQTCIVFHKIEGKFLNGDDMLKPKNYVSFEMVFDDGPSFGFREGKQNINITSFANGAPEHSQALSGLLRLLGIPATSNRPDRDNYVTIHWEHVLKGKEHLLEKDPIGAWFKDTPYDFRSATHAPANYLCDDSCLLGAQTVQPLQDHLWQRTMSMGHATELSNTDLLLTRRLYEKECAKRFNVDSE